MRRLPAAAIALGVGGLIPFLALTVGILFFPAEVPVPRLTAALMGYGAVILSFLGAVHWGLALRGLPGNAVAGPRGEGRAMWTALGLGVVPALVGWAALLSATVADPVVGFLLLLAGFVGTIVVERRAAAAGWMPPGYLVLRYLLTAVVAVCLVAAVVGRLAG
ncbi:MAG: DUF3429 domain-containing protein [Gluconacetobacter diazotrophicus]|nr:DUF3429 domain-containing protein [Gluconacetobacter diazotrophicus]